MKLDAQVIAIGPLRLCPTLLLALCTLCACGRSLAGAPPILPTPQRVATAAPFVDDLNLAHRSLVRLANGTIYIAKGDAYPFTRNTGVLRVSKSGAVATLNFSAERVAKDSNDAVYFLSKGAIFKLSPNEALTLYAGRPGSETDDFIDRDVDGPGAKARLASASDIAGDAHGNLLVQEAIPPNFRIRKIDEHGFVTSYPTMSTEDGAAQDNWAKGAFAVDSSGAIYLGGKDLLRKVVFDGSGHKVEDIWGGPYEEGNALKFSDVYSIAISTDDAVYFRAYAGGLMRLSKSGKIGIVPGTTHCNSDLVDGVAADVGVCIDPGFDIGSDGAIYFVDSGNNALRRLGSDGIVTTIVRGSVPAKW